MLKLPAIIWGICLVLMSFSRHSAWLFIVGVGLLAFGILWLRWDFAQSPSQDTPRAKENKPNQVSR